MNYTKALKIIGYFLGTLSAGYTAGRFVMGGGYFTADYITEAVINVAQFLAEKMEEKDREKLIAASDEFLQIENFNEGELEEKIEEFKYLGKENIEAAKMFTDSETSIPEAVKEIKEDIEEEFDVNRDDIDGEFLVDTVIPALDEKVETNTSPLSDLAASGMAAVAMVSAATKFLGEFREAASL